MSDDFKIRLVSHAKASLLRAERAGSEEATRQYLVLPFFQVLGYDPLNPDEVVPEAQASFADKFKNKVDYAIFKDGNPVIAVETKKVGELKLANRGEIKGYFNALPTVKLGVLTDGLIYELFTDTGHENMMDDEPFARMSLQDVAEGRIDKAAFDAVFRISKEEFDPSGVGADARRKMFFAAYIDALESILNEPAPELVRVLMDKIEVDGNRTSKLIGEHTPIVMDAVHAFMDRKILERVGFANRNDLVRTPPSTTGEAEIVGADAKGEEDSSASIQTTEAELHLFDYVTKRLSFLVNEQSLFERIDDIKWVDHKTVFCIYYRQERKGRLMYFWEGKETKYRLEIGDERENIETNNLADLDEPLLRVFTRRVEELG